MRRGFPGAVLLRPRPDSGVPLFALYLGAGPEAIGLVVGISTVTGIFFKLPAGAVSDLIGRKKTLLAGLVVFAVIPFTYLLVSNYQLSS